MTNSNAEVPDGPPLQGRGLRGVLRRPALRLPALRLNPARAGIVWSDWLFWLFRTVAVFEVLKGLLHWAALLGAGATPFLDMPVAVRIATVCFAVLDPVAGVGMWLTSSWGAVLWLVAAASQIALVAADPAAFGPLWPLVAVEGFAIACYVGLTLRVAAGHDDM